MSIYPSLLDMTSSVPLADDLFSVVIRNLAESLQLKIDSKGKSARAFVANVAANYLNPKGSGSDKALNMLISATSTFPVNYVLPLS